MLSFGTFLESALQTADAIDATVADMRFVKPLDEALIKQLAADHDDTCDNRRKRYCRWCRCGCD
ncbi:hypothetical protein O9929_08740 [Vibrio lentus]|nr:hypothetical protein [Vibrio lentus]